MLMLDHWSIVEIKSTKQLQDSTWLTLILDIIHLRYITSHRLPVAINMPASWDWQTAVLQVMWFEDAYAVSDGQVSNVTVHQLLPIHTATGVLLEMLRLFYTYQVIELYCQFISFQLRWQHPILWLYQ